MNQAINFFWTILCFIPVIGFWIGAGLSLYFYIFAGLGFVTLIIPARLLQLSDSPKFYEGLGVRFIRNFVQNGQWINRHIRKSNPNYKLVKDRILAVKYMQTVVMYERYHRMCFVFFLLTAFYAIILQQYALFCAISVANIIYNICPILLQQYNRARIIALRR